MWSQNREGGVHRPPVETWPRTGAKRQVQHQAVPENGRRRNLGGHSRKLCNSRRGRPVRSPPVQLPRPRRQQPGKYQGLAQMRRQRHSRSISPQHQVSSIRGFCCTQPEPDHCHGSEHTHAVHLGDDSVAPEGPGKGEQEPPGQTGPGMAAPVSEKCRQRPRPPSAAVKAEAAFIRQATLSRGSSAENRRPVRTNRGYPVGCGVPRVWTAPISSPDPST